MASESRALSPLKLLNQRGQRLEISYKPQRRGVCSKTLADTQNKIKINSPIFNSRPATDLTSIVSSNRQSGMHIPVQPSASQYFSSIDSGMSDAASLMSALGGSSTGGSGSGRQTGQHQFQDTFPGRDRLLGAGAGRRLEQRRVTTPERWLQVSVLLSSHLRLLLVSSRSLRSPHQGHDAADLQEEKVVVQGRLL